MKKFSLLALILVMALSLTACGGPATFEEVDVEKYVTLGDYKELSYTEADTKASDYELTVYLNSKLSESGYSTISEEKITEGTVQIGDTANIDFVGKKDGVAFDGGTGSGYSLTIGSGSFIEGFEEGLVGAAIGESVSLNLTFPENYGNEELNGQDVVFDVTINYVESRTTYAELTDTLANTLDSEVSTAAEYIANCRSELEAEKVSDAATDKKNTLWNTTVTNAEIAEKLPEKLLKNAVQEFTNYYTVYAEQSGYDTLSEWLTANSLTQDSFDEKAEEYATNIVKSQLVAYAIAKAEGYTPSEEDVQKSAEEYASANGYTSTETYIKAVGEDAVKDQVVLDYAVDLVVEKAKVS